MKPPILPNLPDALRADLRVLYRELHGDLRALGARCNACGQCCDFHAYDHQLWLTTVELAFLLEHAGPYHPTPGGECPWMKNHQCTAREGRALGCRIFHCTMDKDAMEHLHETYIVRLRSLCEHHSVEVEYGELLSLLDEI